MKKRNLKNYKETLKNILNLILRDFKIFPFIFKIDALYYENQINKNTLEINCIDNFNIKIKVFNHKKYLLYSSIFNINRTNFNEVIRIFNE